jgi:hypothetical protein
VRAGPGAGIFALAAALPYPDLVSTAGPRAPRVFLGHGRFDRRVAHALGLESYRLLDAGLRRAIETCARRATCAWRQRVFAPSLALAS